MPTAAIPELLEGRRFVERQAHRAAARHGLGGADIVWEWRAWDHLVQDFDSTKANYGVVADNQHLIDVNYGSIGSQPRDWHHMNAIDYFPFYDTAGQIIVSVPTFNEVWVIWHDYQFSDDLIWRWGNPAAYQRGDSTDQKLFYQHDIHWGNGLGCEPRQSRTSPSSSSSTTGCPTSDSALVPTARWRSSPPFSMSTTAAMPSTPPPDSWGPEDFQWTYTQPGLNSSGLSSFQRLGNGGSLICNGRTGELSEITADGRDCLAIPHTALARRSSRPGDGVGHEQQLDLPCGPIPSQFPRL